MRQYTSVTDRRTDGQTDGHDVYMYWRIIANLGFKFRSYFTAHCGRRAARRAACGRIISRHDVYITSRAKNHTPELTDFVHVACGRGSIPLS